MGWWKISNGHLRAARKESKMGASGSDFGSWFASMLSFSAHLGASAAASCFPAMLCRVRLRGLSLGRWRYGPNDGRTISGDPDISRALPRY